MTDPASSIPLLMEEASFLENASIRMQFLPLRSPLRSVTWLMVHCLIICSYTFIFGLAMIHNKASDAARAQLIFSSARDAVYYDRVVFSGQLGRQTQYTGPPSVEVDHAWNELVQFLNIRVSAEELSKINKSSIQLADGSGDFMAGLDVHHQLHCLKFIRQYLHPEYYNLTGGVIDEHVDHCLDSLRQAVMCHADIALHTYDWMDKYPKPFPDFVVEHECHNFDVVNQWAKGRAVDIFDGVSLVHPMFGLVYDGNESLHGHGANQQQGINDFGKVITPSIIG